MITPSKKTTHQTNSNEDWWAVSLGAVLILAVVTGFVAGVPEIGQWSVFPLEAFGDGQAYKLFLLTLSLTVLTALPLLSQGNHSGKQTFGFLVLMSLAIVAHTLAQQTTARAAGVGYAFWALLIGLFIANTVGTPTWLKTALRSELYIKTGLVLLGAEILFVNILVLGLPGLFVAWTVTPTVIIFMYQFGTRILKMTSRPLVIVIAAATSVCGVSAAIAAAAAARPKRKN